MTTHTNVNPRLTHESLSSLMRCLRISRRSPSPADRVSAYAELGRPDRVTRLINAWAELQTETLVRSILRGPCAWEQIRVGVRP